MEKSRISRRGLFGIAAAALTLASCGGGSSEPKAAVDIVTKSMTGDMAKTVAHVQIEGIHCVDGCGGQIRSALGEIACVSESQLLDFNAENPVNLVEVTFDPAGCDGQEMISAIHALSDGKYTVKAMEVINYEAGS